MECEFSESNTILIKETSLSCYEQTTVMLSVLYLVLLTAYGVTNHATDRQPLDECKISMCELYLNLDIEFNILEFKF